MQGSEERAWYKLRFYCTRTFEGYCEMSNAKGDEFMHSLIDD